VAATGERQSSKKKKNRMMASLKPGNLDLANNVWPALARLEGRLILLLKKGRVSWMGAVQNWGSGA